MSNQQIQKVKVKRLVHVGLWASDVQAQARFYHRVLGFDLYTHADGPLEQHLEEEDAAIFLALGEEMHALSIFNDTRVFPTNGRRPVVRSTLHHLSFAVDTDAELAAMAARLQMSGIELSFEPRDGAPDLGDALWLNDPDGNRVEISVMPDELYTAISSNRKTRRALLRPYGLQHVALKTSRLEEMVEFYTESLGFDISDWLLRERAWLRCNNDHHSLILSEGQTGIEHVGFTIADGSELLGWADYLSHQQVPLLWGPGRHGVGDDLFLQFPDSDGLHIELSAGLSQYYDRDVTTPPRLWHTRETALNLWGAIPSWLREESHV
ncbi:oxidoreductase [Ktedonobacter sp. SOSP1-85]|uniref:VOC family protein n=1 Tax=Ktedonobacter sp. SOSP1-85 TaxID=2778367 RepID=UPI00191655F1|nr:VOC family protein [Ktedonobacter sp. SOSP1-85]GHO74484.1 oxidoreductase [Ktedonobacter sp. SOSP1-85]